MKVLCLLFYVGIAGLSALHAGTPPAPAKDYYSLQIASATSAQALEKSYQRYATLPFVRVEQRGSLYVLRAGFWEDQGAARQAVAQAGVAVSFIRIASFRPDAIVQKN